MRTCSSQADTRWLRRILQDGINEGHTLLGPWAKELVEGEKRVAAIMAAQADAAQRDQAMPACGNHSAGCDTGLDCPDSWAQPMSTYATGLGDYGNLQFDDSPVLPSAGYFPAHVPTNCVTGLGTCTTSGAQPLGHCSGHPCAGSPFPADLSPDSTASQLYVPQYGSATCCSPGGSCSRLQSSSGVEGGSSGGSCASLLFHQEVRGGSCPSSPVRGWSQPEMAPVNQQEQSTLQRDVRADMDTVVPGVPHEDASFEKQCKLVQELDRERLRHAIERVKHQERDNLDNEYKEQCEKQRQHHQEEVAWVQAHVPKAKWQQWQPVLDQRWEVRTQGLSSQLYEKQRSLQAKQEQREQEEWAKLKEVHDEECAEAQMQQALVPPERVRLQVQQTINLWCQQQQAWQQQDVPQASAPSKLGKGGKRARDDGASAPAAKKQRVPRTEPQSSEAKLPVSDLHTLCYKLLG